MPGRLSDISGMTRSLCLNEQMYGTALNGSVYCGISSMVRTLRFRTFSPQGEMRKCLQDIRYSLK